MDAELLQRAGLLPALHANDALDGVVRRTGDAEHLIPGAEHAEQRHGEGVCAADKVVAHQGVLRAKGVGVDLVQHVPAPVAVAVAGAAHKVALADACLGKGRQHLLLVVALDGFNLRKLGPGQLLGALGGLQQLGGYVKCRVKFHGWFSL